MGTQKLSAREVFNMFSRLIHEKTKTFNTGPKKLSYEKLCLHNVELHSSQNKSNLQ